MATYSPPSNAKIFSVGRGNNYYAYTQDGTTTVVTTGGIVLATSSDGGKSYTYTSTGNKDTNLKNALGDPNSTASKTAKSTTGSSSPNTAPTTKDPDQQGGTTPPTPQLPGPGQDEVGQTDEIDIAGGRGSAGLRYPKKIKSEQDKIKFQAVRILPRTKTPGTGLQFEFGKPQYEPIDGPVCLSIQAPISDQNSVDWGPDTVNAIDAAIYNLSYGAMTGATGEEIKKNMEKAGTEFLTTLYANQGAIQRYLAGQAASINNVLARTDNAVLNPNLELLFQGPQLRPFTFQFKMSARSQQEADEIKSIIKYFKYHMAVRKSTDKIFLKAPHVFTIRYLKGEQQNHPGINVISPNEREKACALTNCSVDYTPLGSYMTYEDGTMSAYTLSLQFQEITPIYHDDYIRYPADIGF
jgi:hypothetical protein